MKGFFIGIVERIMVFTQFYKLFGFTTAPTIDGLLRVAHNHQSSFFSVKFARCSVVNQRNQILPLHFGSVLKFIDKKMTVAFTQPFINEWCRLVLNFPMNNGIKFRNGKHVLFILNFCQFITDGVQQR